MEDYKKKYEDLVDRLIKATEDNDVCDDRYCCVINDIVPELKESENERMLRALREGFNILDKDDEWYSGIKNGQILVWLEKQGEQKPADEVEPKFHEGDWITCKEVNNVRIISIDGNRYEVEFLSGNRAFPHIDYIDRIFHLWTIQDAKAGDVLATDDWVFIFKELNAYGKPVCYCHYDDELGFKVDVNSYLSTGSEIYPATKEQRTLLFQKMHEAGYEWDAEKLELKKIEQKPADEVEPKFKVKYAGSEYNVLEVKDIAGIAFYGIEDEPNHIDYVKAENCEIISGYGIKENGSPYPTKPAVFSEQKPAWSEEDELMFMSTIQTLKLTNGAAQIKIDWLKDLKDRVQPKTTWKPSEEQMEILQYLCETSSHSNEKVMPALESLYNDLKAL